MSIRFVRSDETYYRSCLWELWNSELGKTYFKDINETKKTFDKIVSGENLLIAVDDDRFVGFICYSETGTFNTFPFIHLFVIAEALRGRGYGGEVLDAIESDVRKNGRVFLLVGDFNRRAQAFYEKRGYVKVGSIPQLYDKNVTEHLMMKVLK